MTPYWQRAARRSPEPLPYLLTREDVALRPNASKDSEELLRGAMNLLHMLKAMKKCHARKKRENGTKRKKKLIGRDRRKFLGMNKQILTRING